MLTIGKARLLVLALCSAIIFSATVAAQQIEVKEAWVRGTVPAQKGTGAFMEIVSSNTVRLIGMASPLADTVEIHNMTMQNGVMKMFQVDGIDLPAGKSVKLAPGGYHAMLIGIKQQMKPGDRVPITLTFELSDKKREVLELSVEVRDIRGTRAAAH